MHGGFTVVLRTVDSLVQETYSLLEQNVLIHSDIERAVATSSGHELVGSGFAPRNQLQYTMFQLAQWLGISSVHPLLSNNQQLTKPTKSVS